MTSRNLPGGKNGTYEGLALEEPPPTTKQFSVLIRDQHATLPRVVLRLKRPLAKQKKNKTGI